MAVPNDRIGSALSRLLKWFDTMQISPGAYGGPVAHWWSCSFVYCGPGTNWTYEGLLHAFVELHKKTRNEVWIKRAHDAGSYLAIAQTFDGTYKNSFFELNPVYGSSSVHEASADLGLLSLVSYLEEMGEKSDMYLNAAVKNAEMSLYQRLWDSTFKTFRSTDNTMIKSSYILNIMATIAQVFLKLYLRNGKKIYRELASSTLSFILRYQRTRGNSILFGSFPQGLHNPNAYALYNARIMSFLLDIFEGLKEQKALETAEYCGRFLKNLEQKDGGFAFCADGRGKVYLYPKLIGSAAESIRALLRLKRLSSNFDFNEKPHVEWLLKFQDSIGGFRTAEGFHSDPDKIDYKDIFHVSGWNDKILRLLATLYNEHSLREESITSMQQPCWVGEKKAVFEESEHEVTVKATNGKTVYRWVKGENLGLVDKEYLRYFTRT